MSELFFEVRVVGDVTRCLEEELNVAQLVSGEGAEGDKLLLRGGLLGFQVKPLRSCKSLIHNTQCMIIMYLKTEEREDIVNVFFLNHHVFTKT